MIINKNILKIIVYKVVLNKWKNKVKRINDEYHKYFIVWEHIGIFDGIVYSDDECNLSEFYLYSFSFSGKHRKYNDEIWNHNIEECIDCCNYHPKCCDSPVDAVAKIPKRYLYSSGFENKNGYKN